MIAYTTGTFDDNTAYFSSNPILLGVAVSAIFRAHYICLKVEMISRDGFVAFTSELSQPVTNADAVGGSYLRTFDLKSVAQAAIDSELSMPAGETSGLAEMFAWIMKITISERYIDTLGNHVTNKVANSKTARIVPGGLTDSEISAISSNAEALASYIIPGFGILSRKPEGEMVDRRTNYVLPFTYATGGTVTVKMPLSGTSDYSQSLSSIWSYAASAAFIPLSSISEEIIPCKRDIKLSGYKNGVEQSVTKSIFVYDDDRRYFSFVFLNSFGLPESFTCYSLESETRSIDNTTLDVLPSLSMRGVKHQISRKSLSNKIIRLSSGILPSRDWNEWFVSEFLMTKQAIMRHPDTGKWHKVVIIPEDENTISDLTSSTAITFEFDVEISDSGADIKAHFLR